MPRVRKSLNSLKSSNIIWKIALYIRLSREDGNDESLSVVNQKKILTEYVEALDERFEIADYYVDDGLTGTDYERPDFQRMMKDIEDKRVNCVIVKDLARAFRNYSDQGFFLETFFPTHNIRFITVGSPKIDSYLNPESINGFDVPITGVMNDRYCKKTSDDIRRTFDMKRRKGEFIGAFAPYGYSKDPEDKNSFVIDEEAAQIVKDIFSWFVNEGYSKMGIVKRLNSMGVPNPTAYKKSKGMKFQTPVSHVNDGLWSSCTISSILSNKTYIGYMVQGRFRIKSYKVHTQINVPEDEWFVVPDTHEPIIDKETFDKAQNLQLRDMRTAPEKREVYLFSGFLRCADCKKAMTRKTSKDRVYYCCRTYRDKSKEKCSRHSIKLEILEKSVLTAIRKQIELVDSLTEMIDEINKAPVVRTQSNRLNHLLKMREQELEKVKSLTDGLYLDWKSGDITRDDYRRMKGKFEEQTEQLQEAVANLREEIQVMANGISTDDPYLTSFLKFQNITTLERGLLVELINTIYVHEGGELTIEFNFEDDYKRVMEYIENNHNDLTLVENAAI